MRCEHCSGEISDAAVLSHAQSLRSRMRKNFRGAKPQMHRCPRCGVELAGRRMLEAHFSLCAAGPLESVTPEDIAAMGWEPKDAA